MFKKQVEHIYRKSRKTNIHVEKGFYTKQKMKDELKWDASQS